MAIRNGSLYIGNAVNDIGLITNHWYPLTFNGSYDLLINGTSTFKVVDEASFFGAYAGSPNMKSKIYNDLRFQINKNGAGFKNSLEELFVSNSYRDPQFITYKNLIESTFTATSLPKAASVAPITSDIFENNFKVYTDVTFDDVNLIGKVKAFYGSYGLSLSYLS